MRLDLPSLHQAFGAWAFDLRGSPRETEMLKLMVAQLVELRRIRAAVERLSPPGEQEQAFDLEPPPPPPEGLLGVPVLDAATSRRREAGVA